MTVGLQAFQIMLIDPPLRGRRKPIVTAYVVTANTADEARAVFEAEWPELIAPLTRVTVTPRGCRVTNLNWNRKEII